MGNRLNLLAIIVLLWSAPALGAPVFVSQAVKQPGRGVAPCTITPGAPIQSGDLLVLDYIAPPAFPGGTCSSQSPVENWSCTNQIGSYGQVWWKIAGAADVAASTLTFNAASSWNVCALVDYRGVNQSNPVGPFVINTGTGTTMTVGATSGLANGSSVLLLLNQDDANVAGFGIQTITPPSSPWNTRRNFSGNVSPFSASLALLDQIGVTSTAATTATMSGSDQWVTIAIPINPSALTGATVAENWPPTFVGNLVNYHPLSGTFPTSLVTDAAACVQGQAPVASSPSGVGLCRVGWNGSTWVVISNPNVTPPGNTFSVNNPCTTSVRATGGCTFNGVTYGAGGTPLPTLNVANTATVNCLGTSGDADLFIAAMGSGGTAGSHRGIKVVGAQCDITKTVFIPPFVDIQGANSTTVILNPYGTSTTCNNGPSGQASFQINGPTQGGTIGHDITISNLTFSGINTIPPYYPGRTGNSGSACSSLTMSVLIEHASNITIEDNLFKNCTGQACVEALGGSSATPDNSNVVQNWNTYDGCALYGPDDDNVTNAPTNHNYALDCQFGNELDNSTQTGSYTVNYNYSRRRTSFGYNIDWVCTDGGGTPGPASLSFYCATQNPTSCQMIGNILDATGSALVCTTFGSHQGELNLSGGHNSNGNLGLSASQNYCYNGSCGCGGGIGGGCIIATPPNPAPSGP